MLEARTSATGNSSYLYRVAATLQLIFDLGDEGPEVRVVRPRVHLGHNQNPHMEKLAKGSRTAEKKPAA